MELLNGEESSNIKRLVKYLFFTFSPFEGLEVKKDQGIDNQGPSISYNT